MLILLTKYKEIAVAHNFFIALLLSKVLKNTFIFSMLFTGDVVFLPCTIALLYLSTKVRTSDSTERQTGQNTNTV